MRLAALLTIILLALGGAAASQPLDPPNERDYILTDDEGHLVLRFAGAGPRGPGEPELEEFVNASVSTMIHDELRADLLFSAEPRDSAWADSMEPKVRSQVAGLRHRFSAIEIECHSASCRILMDQNERLGITEHQALMDVVQRTLEPLTGADPAGFDRIFLIAAYEQQFWTPQIKVYLRRPSSPD